MLIRYTSVVMVMHRGENGHRLCIKAGKKKKKVYDYEGRHTVHGVPMVRDPRELDCTAI